MLWELLLPPSLGLGQAKVLHWRLFIFSVPQRVYGEGNYEITSVVEVETTSDFDGMDESAIGCQNQITCEEFVNKKFIEDVILKCKCLPFEFWTHEAQVRKKTLVHHFKTFPLDSYLW